MNREQDTTYTQWNCLLKDYWDYFDIFILLADYNWVCHFHSSCSSRLDELNRNTYLQSLQKSSWNGTVISLHKGMKTGVRLSILLQLWHSKVSEEVYVGKYWKRTQLHCISQIATDYFQYTLLPLLVKEGQSSCLLTSPQRAPVCVTVWEGHSFM